MILDHDDKHNMIYKHTHIFHPISKETKESLGAGSPSPESEVAIKQSGQNKSPHLKFLSMLIDIVEVHQSYRVPPLSKKKSLQLCVLGETVGCVGRKNIHLACHHRSYETGRHSDLRHLIDFSKFWKLVSSPQLATPSSFSGLHIRAVWLPSWPFWYLPIKGSSFRRMFYSNGHRLSEAMTARGVGFEANVSIPAFP